MGRIFTCFLLMELGIWVLLSPANCISFSVEDRVHQLTEDFINMKEVLANKDVRLQQVRDDLLLLTENFSKNTDVLAAKDVRLEELLRGTINVLQLRLNRSRAVNRKRGHHRQEFSSDFSSQLRTYPIAQFIRSSHAWTTRVHRTIARHWNASILRRSLANWSFVDRIVYSVIGAEQVETVYCDFKKLPSDSGFQKWIGFNDIKSLPVYFYVQRNTNGFNTTGTPIPFELARLNIGNAMDLSSGKFTAPRAGTYHFEFRGYVNFPNPSSSRLILNVGIYLNGNLIGNGQADEVSTAGQFELVSIHSTLSLKTGDQIWLVIWQMSSGAYLYDSSGHYTHFSGWLLEENLSQLLE